MAVDNIFSLIKTMITNKRTILSICILTLIFLLSGKINAQNAPITTCGSVNNAAPGIITIPITVAGFANITGLSLRLEYNPAVISFSTFINSNTQLNGLMVNDLPASAGLRKIIISWADANGQSLSPNAKILDLVFEYQTGSTSLSWNNTSNNSGDC